MPCGFLTVMPICRRSEAAACCSCTPVLLIESK